MFESKEVCGHRFPNVMQIIGPEHQFSFDQQDIWSILLRVDNTAEGTFCPNGKLDQCDNKKVHGSWQTMMGTELIVYLENGLRFVASFRYELRKEKVNGVPPYRDGMKYENLHQPDDSCSVCNQTMVGWVQNTLQKGSMEHHPVTCFFAQRDKR